MEQHTCDEICDDAHIPELEYIKSQVRFEKKIYKLKIKLAKKSRDAAVAKAEKRMVQLAADQQIDKYKNEMEAARFHCECEKKQIEERGKQALAEKSTECDQLNARIQSLNAQHRNINVLIIGVATYSRRK